MAFCVDELFKPDLLFLARDGSSIFAAGVPDAGENKSEERVELRLFYKIDSLHRFVLVSPGSR